MPPPQPLLLVLELPRTIDRSTPRSVSINEIAALDHEVFDDTVEFAAFVALRTAQVVFRLASAELAEIFGSARHAVGVELHFDASEGFAAKGDVEEDDGVFGGGGHCCVVVVLRGETGWVIWGACPVGRGLLLFLCFVFGAVVWFNW
jgi:hypothetical protein